MVNPIYILTLSLAAGFLLTLIDKSGRKLSLTVFYGILSLNVFIIGEWFYRLTFLNTPTVIINTAGFSAPLSINLQLGMQEAFVLLFANLTALLSAVYLFKKFKETHISGLILYLIMIVGVNGLVMTRDLFNMFVFSEILSISTYALITLTETKKSLSAGFKYMIAGGIASTFFLLGVTFIYYFTGNLNLDFIHLGNFSNLGFISIFLLAIAVFIELKPFPANGWALDVYEAVDSGIVSVIAVVNSAAIFFVFYKIMPILPQNFLNVFGIAGVITFFFSNLMGLKQKNAKRLLGYSSIGQIGLLVASLIFTMHLPRSLMYLIVGGFFFNHLIAKAGLFWITGIVKKENLKDWNVLKNNKPLLVLFGILLFALAGFPPFAGFWAKWEFVKMLVHGKMFFVVGTILLGSLFEVIFLFRWFTLSIKGDEKTEHKNISLELSKMFPTTIFAGITILISVLIMKFFYDFNWLHALPVLAVLIINVIDFLPSKIKGILSLAAVLTYGYLIYPLESNIQLFFGIIFIIGSAINIIGTLNRKGKSEGFYGLLLMMIFSFGNLLVAITYLEFFLSWEFMTISSFLLILRGKKAQKASMLYLIFSTAGAYLMMVGFSLAPDLVSNSVLILSISNVSLPIAATILLSIGFMIKSGSLGVHIWLPEAHAEAESDVSPFISAILLKAGVFGLLMVGISYIKHTPSFDIFYWIGWIGVLTAIVGAFLASFQEDAKRLLAYSSMSQVGYIVASIAILSHLGWLSAMYLSFNHMMFKSALFIAIAGVYYRTHTRTMYEMGGLIKKMPLSFISVLIMIIAVSGVPPLSGFGAKWLIYSSFIEKGWYLQAGVLFFASGVSFLYLYRIIHTIFLGQLKYEHQNVKEAPIWFIIPQYIFIIGIMAISMFPNLIIQPLNSIAMRYFNSSIIIDGYTISSSLGYWNGNLVMYVTMGVFVVPLIFLMLFNGRMQKVKQFNIVYAAERPESPQTTHVAHNMYAHYRKALGGWGKPRIWDFWHEVSEWSHSLADSIRQLYTGNGQTYILHIIMYVIVIYFISGV
ncbi:MAG: proton-conducting transporter membrane subunit [Candidatus Tenebribacter burtonii]|jgi:formate hydrogenlyase subunit 3/multisubunit Na+/H+ antiporter MnhD subunit|nr:proton-conducting transporter membrane subunit [Candidatus Tenebribacter burtonii]